MPQRWRESNGGHMALVMLGSCGFADGDEMRPGAQPLRGINGTEPDKSWTVQINQRWTTRHQVPNEIFFLRHHTAETQITRGGLAVDLTASDMALLEPHDAEGFGAIGSNAERIARGHDRPNGGIAIGGRHRQL